MAVQRIRTSLPLQALLEAIDAWAARPDDEPLDELGHAIDRLTTELGASGASIRLRASTLPALDLQVGSQDGPAARIELEFEPGDPDAGVIEVFGDQPAREAALGAIELAIRLAWAR